MFAKTESHSPLRTRKEAAEDVNQAMERFPLIINILGELRKANVPFPGDDDIRHGCERALTAMLVELARIEPAPSDNSQMISGPAVRLLQSKESADLINSDQLQRMDQFVERILGAHGHH